MLYSASSNYPAYWPRSNPAGIGGFLRPPFEPDLPCQMIKFVRSLRRNPGRKREIMFLKERIQETEVRSQESEERIKENFFKI